MILPNAYWLQRETRFDFMAKTTHLMLSFLDSVNQKIFLQNINSSFIKSLVINQIDFKIQ